MAALTITKLGLIELGFSTRLAVDVVKIYLRFQLSTLANSYLFSSGVSARQVKWREGGKKIYGVVSYYCTTP